MAVANPRKVFQFGIEIDGVDQLLIQDVKKPEAEIGAVEHGASNHNIKTAGGVAVSDAELQGVKSAPLGDNWAWDWLQSAQDMESGTGGLSEDYKKDVIFKEFGPGGTPVSIEIWEGAWVRKVSPSNFKRGNQSENVIETVTMSVDKIIKVM